MLWMSSHNFKLGFSAFLLVFSWFKPARTLAQSNETWIDSRPFLQDCTLPKSPQSFARLDSVYSILAKTLNNGDQHRQLAEIRSKLNNKPISGRFWILPADNAQPGIEGSGKNEIQVSIGSSMGRELKSAALPDYLQKGLRFSFGGSQQVQPVDVHKPHLQYGLILANVEPHPEPFRLASLANTNSDEYALVPYAPKAQLHYIVGPVTELDALDKATLPSTVEPQSGWTSNLPDLQFKGKIAPHGTSTGSNIIPTQVLTLEQVQGFYALEVQTSQLIHRDSVLHRMRLPLLGPLNLREERNQDFKSTRRTLENVYVRDNLAVNVDYFEIEKRYQTGLIFQQDKTRLEFNNHLPVPGSVPANFWQKQRWELKLQTGF